MGEHVATRFRVRRCSCSPRLLLPLLLRLVRQPCSALSVPYSPLPPSVLPIFYGNLTKGSLLPPRYIAICSARYKAIEYVCQYRGIEPANPERERRVTLILTVISPANMVLAKDYIGAMRAAALPRRSRALHRYIPPLVRGNLPRFLAAPRCFSCPVCACYSFVDRRSSSGGTSPSGCSRSEDYVGEGTEGRDLPASRTRIQGEEEAYYSSELGFLFGYLER